MTKTYHLLLNNLPLTLTLTPPPSWGYCVVCFKTKEIRIIAQHANQLRRNFCNSCASDKLTDLAHSDYKFVNRPETLKEIRSFLLGNYSVEEKDKEILACYG